VNIGMHNAVGAVDPAHGNKFVIWTEHTVLGGAGSEVRWYELDPAGNGNLQCGTASSAVIQCGRVTDPNLYIFNGAITPDRAASLGVGGSDFAITFNTSSATTPVTVDVVYQRSGQGQSVFGLIKASPWTGYVSPQDGCNQIVCRWGDYSGASPDPIQPRTFWFTNMYVGDFCLLPICEQSLWRTINWSVTVG
jgi:hypothetical protein